LQELFLKLRRKKMPELPDEELMLDEVGCTLLYACPTCGAEPEHWCTGATWENDSRGRTVHAARNDALEAGIDRVARQIIAEEDAEIAGEKK